MEFRVLGDLEVRRDGAPIPLGPRQQRAVLGLLVLHAGEVLAAGRIVDELWGEAPPPTATKTVHVYVSRLRKALGDGSATVIETHDHGYVLRVDPDDVDALRFERLVGEGRRAIGCGDAARASEVLAAALALWRGPLVDLGLEEAHRAHGARLEELRLEALETRMDADLALGRHAELVAELELEAALHPLRERLQRQRMLALYRSGRQAEALGIYRETRARLVGELGIEPSVETRDLHDAMLRHDPALHLRAAPGRPAPVREATEPEAARREVAAAAPGGPRRRFAPPLAALLAALALVAGVAVVVTLLARSPGALPRVRVGADRLAVFDPASRRLLATVPVGARPATPTAAGDSVWVANLDDDTVTRVDAATERLRGTMTPGGSVTGTAAGDGALWVGDAASARVRRVDPAIGVVTRTSSLPGGIAGPPGNDLQEPLAVAGRSLWAGHGGVVTHLDARSGRRLATIPIGFALVGIAVGAGATWIIDALDDNVLRIVDDSVVARIPTGHGPAGIAFGAGAVWVAQRFDGTVARIDPSAGRITDTIRVGDDPRGVTVLGHSIWVADSGDGTLSQIDARTRRLVHTVRVGNSPTGVAAIRGRLWVSVQQPAGAVAGPGARGVVRVARTEALDTPNDSLDPALAYSAESWQVLYATCAKLYNEPDAAGAAGSRIVPEVARSFPVVSADGLRQTFTIRPGFRLSPPSGAAVTAQTFLHAIERSVDPAWPGSPPARAYLDDVVGVRAFEHRRARHIAGLSASGDRLVIRTTRPAPDLPLRLSMPFFCAVPTDAPVRRGGVRALPMAGPYYVASAISGRQIVLVRNPGYRGARPARAAAIDLRLGVPAATAVADVATGKADLYEPPPGSDALLDRTPQTRRGPGHWRLFVDAAAGEQYIALNTVRPLFAHARLRRAVSFAIDRAALAAQSGADFSPLRPTDQYIPPPVPGFRDVSLYPLRGDLARARRLAGPGHRHATFLSFDFAPFTSWAAIVRANLARIGIDVTVRAVPIPEYTRKLGDRHADYDLAFFGWYADFPDPDDVLGVLLRGNRLPAAETHNDSFFDDPAYNRRLDAAARLRGPARYAAYADLDRDLAGEESPIVAFGVPVQKSLFGTRLGCHVFQAAAGGIDLAALCVGPR